MISEANQTPEELKQAAATIRWSSEKWQFFLFGITFRNTLPLLNISDNFKEKKSRGVLF